MSKRKIFALLLLSGSYVMALGFNCLPNIGGDLTLDCLLGGLGTG